MRTTLVVAEVALAVMLLAGAGLLIRSFGKLAAVDPGFDVKQALTFEVSLPESRYGEPEQQVAYFDDQLPRLEAIPGVRKASGTFALPLSGMSFVLTFEVAGRPPVPPSQQPAMQVRIATADYFESIGIPLERGRYFTERDRAGTPRVVLLTAAAVKQYFPGEDPIGKTITLGWGRDGQRAGGAEPPRGLERGDGALGARVVHAGQLAAVELLALQQALQRADLRVLDAGAEPAVLREVDDRVLNRIENQLGIFRDRRLQVGQSGRRIVHGVEMQANHVLLQRFTRKALLHYLYDGPQPTESRSDSSARFTIPIAQREDHSGHRPAPPATSSDTASSSFTTSRTS